MRTAPAVHLSLEADTPWRVGLCLLGAAAAAAPVAWLAQWLQPEPGGAPAAAALAAALGAAGLLWRRSDSGAQVLAWDGTQWRLQAGGAAARTGRLHLVLDLGSWLLLRFEPNPGRPPLRVRWLALSQHGHRAEWHALRCALHAAAAAAAGAPGTP